MIDDRNQAQRWLLSIGVVANATDGLSWPGILSWSRLRVMGAGCSGVMIASPVFCSAASCRRSLGGEERPGGKPVKAASRRRRGPKARIDRAYRPAILGLRRKHLQSYLDEFVFRFNRRRTRNAAFRSLLSIGLITKPITYKC